MGYRTDAEIARAVIDKLDRRQLLKRFEVSFAYNVACFYEDDPEHFIFKTASQRATATEIADARPARQFHMENRR